MRRSRCAGEETESSLVVPWRPWGESHVPGDLVKVPDAVQKVFLRKSSYPEFNGGYGRSTTLDKNAVALVIQVRSDGDCYLITSNGQGWLTSESLQKVGLSWESSAR